MPAHGSFAPNLTLHPEDLECVSEAFERTLRYLNERPSRFDIMSARDYAACLIIERAREGERDTHKLWSAAIRALEEKSRTAVGRRGEL